MNGIRGALAKGFLPWLKATKADIVCLQEIKATPDQVDVEPFRKMGYEMFWMPAEKKGYSGVALFTKLKPSKIVLGCSLDIYDKEGRVIRADFDGFSVMSVYMPSGSRGDDRQAFKIQWLTDFKDHIDSLSLKSRLVICGDFNICHHPMDIHNPTANKYSPGFLPAEREWLGRFLENGFIDTFRYFNKNPHHYTWWSYRAGARRKNLGWRIDYALAGIQLESRLKRASILHQAVHSDHCPVLLELQ